MNKVNNTITNRYRSEAVIKDIALQLLASGLIGTEYVIATKEEKRGLNFTLYHNIPTPFPKICGIITEKEARAQMFVNNEEWTAVLTLLVGKGSRLDIAQHTERSYVEKLHAICTNVMAAHNVAFWDEGIKNVAKPEIRKQG